VYEFFLCLDHNHLQSEGYLARHALHEGLLLAFPKGREGQISAFKRLVGKPGVQAKGYDEVSRFPLEFREMPGALFLLERGVSLEKWKGQTHLRGIRVAQTLFEASGLSAEEFERLTNMILDNALFREQLTDQSHPFFPELTPQAFQSVVDLLTSLDIAEALTTSA